MTNGLPPSEPEKPGEGKKRPDLQSIRPAQKAKMKGEDFLTFARENTKDTIAYILLIVGILLSFFNSVWIYGEIIVGVVFGVYFVKELAYLVTNASRLVEENGITKSLIFGGTLLALFIAAPFIIIGAAIVTVLKLVLLPESAKKDQ